MKKKLSGVKINLFTKLLFTYMVVISLFIVVLLFLGSFLYHNFFTRFYHNMQITNATEIAQSLSEDGLFTQGKYRDLQNKIDTYAKFVEANLWVFNNEGRIIVESAGGVRVRKKRDSHKKMALIYPDRTDIEVLIKSKGLMGHEDPWVYQDSVNYGARTVLFTYAPLEIEGEVSGGVVLFSPFPPARALVRIDPRFLSLAALIAFAAAALLGYYLSRRITKPLKEMTKAAVNMTAGNFSTLPPVKTGDEVEELAHSFNHLARELENKINELSREKERISTITSNMAEGIIGFNKHGQVVYYNPRVLQLLGGINLPSSLRQLVNQVLADNQQREIVLTQDADPEGKAGIVTKGKGFRVNASATGVDRVYAAAGKSRILSVRVEPLSGPEHERGAEEETGNVREFFTGANSHAHDNDLDSGCFMVIYDITERWKYEQMQKEFVANVSHELRTPLALIQGYIEAFIDNYVEDPSKSLQIIYDETIRLKKIVNDLLSLAALDRGDEEKEPVSLRRAVRNIIELAEAQGQNEGFRFSWRVENPCLELEREAGADLKKKKEPISENDWCDEGQESLEATNTVYEGEDESFFAGKELAQVGKDPSSEKKEGYTTAALCDQVQSGDLMVMGNYDRLQQIIINLIDNALRYSKPPGKIRVSIGRKTRISARHEQKNYCFIRVRDEGIGIPESELPHIWDRFYRVDKSGSRAKGGSGLGLAIVKHIVEYYGGFFTVESKEGVGSVFTVYLPAL